MNPDVSRRLAGAARGPDIVAINKCVLFVCVENAGRSQMAEALARLYGGGEIEAFSAGSRPSGRLNPDAVAVLEELGCDHSGHRSKGLDEIPPGPYDRVVTMGCGDACPWIEAAHREDWALPDPKTLDRDGVRAVRDEIERRVLELLDRMAEE